MADVASREGLVQVMRECWLAPDSSNGSPHDWRLRGSCATTGGQQEWDDALSRAAAATINRLRRKKQAGRVRDDIPSDVVQGYLDLVLDGLVAKVASGEDTPCSPCPRFGRGSVRQESSKFLATGGNDVGSAGDQSRISSTKVSLARTTGPGDRARRPALRVKDLCFERFAASRVAVPVAPNRAVRAFDEPPYATSE